MRNSVFYNKFKLMNRKINYKNISIIGLGKVGTCLAVSFASKGFKVYGYDVDEYPLRCLREKRALYFEPYLQEFLNNYYNSIFISDLKTIAQKTDVTIIIVPTPSKKDGSFSNKYLISAVRNLAKEIKNKNKFHIFVIASTVSPLSIDNQIIPIIEKFAQKKLNEDFGVIYNPQFIALGSVIKNILEPDFVLIGESSKKVGDILERIYKNLLNNDAPICRMNLISAEIAKIAFNCFTTIKMSFTNFLGNVCEQISGANINDIMNAITNDKRIVGKFGFKYGVAYGGPCLPRDNKAFANFVRKNTHFKPLLAIDAHKINEFQNIFLSNKILNFAKKEKIKDIIFYGISYKVNTGIIEESATIKTVKILLNHGRGDRFKIFLYDPVREAVERAKKIFLDQVFYIDNEKELITVIKNRNKKIIVLMNPYKEVERIKNTILSNKNKISLIDPWNVLNKN
jgi:UDPglucose 6-dehydrogenase